MLIAVINESSRVSNADVQTMCLAIQKQLTLHVSPAWNQKSPKFKFYATKAKVPGYAWVVSIIDNPDVAGALGYHDEQNDHPDGFVFCSPVLDNGGGILTSPSNITVSSVLSHESIELAIDRFCNSYCDNGDTSWAVEACDPCQEFGYLLDGVLVSDFVFESFFNPQAVASDNLPFDYMNKLAAPFTIGKGGYAITRKGGPGTETQTFGEEMPEWLKHMKMSTFSRISNR